MSYEITALNFAHDVSLTLATPFQSKSITLTLLPNVLVFADDTIISFWPETSFYFHILSLDLQAAYSPYFEFYHSCKHLQTKIMDHISKYHHVNTQEVIKDYPYF